MSILDSRNRFHPVTTSRWVCRVAAVVRSSRYRVFASAVRFTLCARLAVARNRGVRARVVMSSVDVIFEYTYRYKGLVNVEEIPSKVIVELVRTMTAFQRRLCAVTRI